jgi:hypothetical protein
MKITVHTKPHARKNEVIPIDEHNYIVSVTAPAVDGKANEKLVSVLADFFKKPRRSITIIRGGSSRIKIVNIE